MLKLFFGMAARFTQLEFLESGEVAPAVVSGLSLGGAAWASMPSGLLYLAASIFSMTIAFEPPR